MFYNNGVVVQEYIESSNTSIDYFGLSRFVSWPLEKNDDTKSKQICEDLANDWAKMFSYANKQIYNINTIKSDKILQEYLNIYGNRKVRIICVETEYDFYERMPENFEKEPFGFDYIYPTEDFYSAIGNEYDIVEKLGFKNKLNKYGLFDNVADLKKFIELRNIKQKDLKIEPNDDFIIVKISKVIMK